MQLKKVIRKQKSKNLNKNKKASILTENIIFIILNLIFLTVLIVFLLRQGSGTVVLEQSYAKQLALLIDSSQPGMLIELDMTKAIEVAANNGLEARDIIDQSISERTKLVKEQRLVKIIIFERLPVLIKDLKDKVWNKL